MELANNAGIEFAKQKVIGASEDKLIKIRVNCAYQDFQVKIHPSLAGDVSNIEKGLREAYSNIQEQINVLLQKHTASYMQTLETKLQQV